MPGPAAVCILLSETLRSLLDILLRRQSSSQSLVRRIQIILDASLGGTNEGIAKERKISIHSVRLWRRRWPSIGLKLEELKAAYQLEGLSESKIETLLLRALEEELADESRRGAPATFTPEQIVAIVALSLEDPADSERPVTHWTAREIADEAVKRKIVPQISLRSVGRFLKGERPQTASQQLLAATGD